MADVEYLKRKSRQIRATCVQLAHDVKFGHVGSVMSCVEGLVALYYHWLNVSPATVRDPHRDRFLLSKGHACTGLYAILADRGFFPVRQLREYVRTGSMLPHHPFKDALPLLECSSESPGHCLGVATGMLYGLRLSGSPARAAVLLSDGECNEDIVWESAMFAAANKLDRLVALVDYNGIQAAGRTDEIMGCPSPEDKFRAIDWGACTVDGNDVAAVMAALDSHPLRAGRPTAIILRTKKGAGVSFMEDQVLWHERVPSDEDLRQALKELNELPIHLPGAAR